MIETLTIITLSVLYLIYFRPGKTPPLNNPLIIERLGKYHITLAPRLNLAQPFIEAVIRQIGTSSESTKYSSTQYFEVRDNQVKAHGHKSYLLAISQRNGMLYFYAVSPQTDDLGNYLAIIREFSDANLSGVPVIGQHDSEADQRIVATMQEVALLQNIHINNICSTLPEPI